VITDGKVLQVSAVSFGNSFPTNPHNPEEKGGTSLRNVGKQ
jgi:hypothetical protein